MHTHLIFFDSVKQSIQGVIRGTIAFVLIIIFDYIWYELLLKKFYSKYMSSVNICKKTLALVMSSLLLCCAIAIAMSSSSLEAFVYGALVGLVVHGFYNFFNLYAIQGWDFRICLVDTFFGIISLGIVSYIIYNIFFYHKVM